MSQSSSPSSRSAAAPLPVARSRRRYLALVIVILAVAVAAGLTWKWRSRPPLVEPPVVDHANADPAIGHAIEKAREEVRRAPDSSRAWGRLGMILLVHQFRAEAGICLAHAEQLDPQDVRWPYYQALAVRLSDPETAIAHLRRALAADGEEHEAPRLLLGELLVQRGQLEEADTLFHNLLNRDAHNSRAHLGLARLAFERDDLPASLSHLREAKDDPRTRKAAHVLLAEVRQRRGEGAAATEAVRQEHNLPDDDPWPDPLAEQFQALGTGRLWDSTRALLLLRQDRIDEALVLLQQMLKVYPDVGQEWLLLGRVLLRGGNVPEAERAFRNAARLEPESAESHFYLGVILFEQRKPREAASYFRKAAELKPDYAMAYYNLGHCLKQQGDRAGALAAFRTAVACKPRFAAARTNLGELLAEEGQFDAALEQLRQAPDDARAKQLLESVRKRAAKP